MSTEQDIFDHAITEAIQRIPAHLQEKIKNVAFLVEDNPSPEVRKREGLSDTETLLGYYQGIPHTVRGDSYGIGMTMPDTITLYRNPIVDAAGHDETRIVEVVRDTVLHEVAHYFGMNEEEVTEWEERGRVSHAQHTDLSNGQ